MTIIILLGYLIIMNVYTFTLMGMDKQYARKHARRVPEKRIFILSAVGGAFGAYIGMRVWRHKTKHRSFVIGLPLLVLFNLVLIYFIAGFYGLNFDSISF
ncbi:MAG: DUF1294 domain-containing protein [Candidatus Pristimantibacillus sp.]